MQTAAKPIRVINTGGTWSMGRGSDGRLSVLPLEQVQSAVADLAVGASIELTPWLDASNTAIPAVDSSVIGPAQWQQLAEQVLRETRDYSGFVVLHGTDTLSYTGAALAFALQAHLQKANKTLVVTGSQRPLLDNGSDAPRNIKAALQAASGFDGYALKLVFGSGNWPAVYVSKFDSDADQGFLARRLPRAGPAGLPAMPLECADPAAFAASGVTDITLQPTTTKEALLAQLLAPGVRLAVLRLYGAGTVAPQWQLLETLKQAQQQSHGRFLGALAISACANGELDWGRYAASPSAADTSPLVSGAAMTPEAAVAKCAWILGSEARAEKALTLLSTNVLGELGTL